MFNSICGCLKKDIMNNILIENKYWRKVPYKFQIKVKYYIIYLIFKNGIEKALDLIWR
jgi:hypothetical protein